MAIRRIWRWAGIVGGIAAAFLSLGLSETEEDRLAARRRAEAEARFEAALPLAASGVAEAQFTVAECFRQGMGVARDPAKAVGWYLKAAERAHSGAQYALGVLAESGEGVPRDYVRAAEWYRLAAEVGRHPDAQFALAQMVYKGRGLPSDPGEALAWYRRAAAGGHPAAQFVLGTLYERGWNVEADPVEAYLWFTLAMRERRRAMAVDTAFDPVAARHALAARMTRFQIARGDQRAAEWQATILPANRPHPPVLRVPSPADPTSVPPVAARSVAVRLFAFDAPTGIGRTARLALSLLVEFDEAAMRTAACRLAPRLREAAFETFWESPLPAPVDPAALRTAADRLIAPLDRVLGRPAVRRAYLFPGEAPLTVNEALQTPFDRVEECPQEGAAG